MLKNSTQKFSSILIAGLFTLFVGGCSKPDGGLNTSPTVTLPTVTTTAVSGITPTGVISGGTVASDGNATVTARGVVWKTSTNPTTADSKTTDGTGAGNFVSNLTGLIATTTYYVRAYATNSAGTSYGNEISFTTTTPPPGVVLATLTTAVVNGITQTTAASGGTITSDGGGAVTARGIAWNTSTNPTIANSFNASGTGIGSFNGSLTGLNANTTYFVKAYATNSAGTAYGNEVTFTTSPAPGIVLPTLTTSAISAITQTTAAGGGNITNDGGAAVTTRGIAWSTSPSPTVSNNINANVTGIGAFTGSLTGLTAGTTYFVRAYAANSAGTAYGNEVSFTTSPALVVLATLTTTAISAITQTTATSGGNITSDGGATVTARGIAWGTSANPTIANSTTTNGTGIGTYTSSLTGLTANTTYFVRAYATNSAGTAYGNQVSFTTSPAGPTTFNISISGFAFSPSTLTVRVGDIVIWTNNDAAAHTVTSNNGTSFSSGSMAQNAIFTYTATTTGSFPYRCAIHPSMTASITVIP